MLSNQHQVVVRTPGRIAFVDLTDHAARAVRRDGVNEGLLVAFSRHTTCGLIINEWEEGALDDLRCRIESLFPRAAYYAHDDMKRRKTNVTGPAEPRNGHAHVAQMLLGGSSQTIPLAGGRLALGRWQRLFLAELDGPRDRTVLLQTIGVPSSTQSRVRNNQKASPAYLP